MFKLLKPYLKENILNIIILLVYLIILFPMNLIIPYINGMYIDKLTLFANKNIVIIFCIIIGTINIIGIVGNYILNKLYLKLQTQIGFEMNIELLEHFKKIPLRTITKYNPGYISDRINTDCNVLSNFIITLILNFFNKFFSTIAIIVIVIRIDYRISIIFAVLIPLYLIIYNCLKKLISTRLLKYKECKNEYISEYYNQSSNVKYIKIQATFYKYKEKLFEMFDKLLKSFLAYIDSTYLFSSMEQLVTYTIQLTILFIGGISIIEKNYQ